MQQGPRNIGWGIARTNLKHFRNRLKVSYGIEENIFFIILFILLNCLGADSSYGLRISESFTCTDNSYLTHIFSTRITLFLYRPHFLNQDYIIITCGKCTDCIKGHLSVSSKDAGFSDDDVQKTAE